jgi:arsenate reductase
MKGGIDFSKLEGCLPRTDGILNLSPHEAAGFLSDGAILVDLREAYETNFRVFDVEEVVCLPWSSFRERYATLPVGEALILADASGIYSREAARILAQAGYANLAKLSGGMIDWDAAGLPVRRDAEYELGGQCACKMKTRHGGNPLIDKRKQPDSSAAPAGAAPVDPAIRVLFLCVHNSARSQMAEAFLKRLGGDRFVAESAGLEPGHLNPQVVRAMAEAGIDISHNATKGVLDLLKTGRDYDVVVTVCSKEAAERCPVFPGMHEKFHWPLADPSAMQGSDEEIMAGVREVRDGIEAAVREFIAAHA